MISEEFEAACREASDLPDVEPDALLDLYGLYKQVCCGDVVGRRPGVLDLRAQAKFDAWGRCRGMTTEQAMSRYVQRVRALVQAVAV